MSPMIPMIPMSPMIPMTWTRKWTLALAALIVMCAPMKSAADDTVAQGRQLYLEYCGSCHGLTGEGDGPVAQALTTPPANLRRLSDRFGDPLPEDRVARFIDGRAEVKAHGPRDMPVWGRRFYGQTHDERVVRVMIRDLVAYLQSIQTGARHARR